MHALCYQPGSKLARFVVESTDVLADMRINVYEESAPDKVLWYKERFLSDTEIVEHIVHNPTSTVCWSIHRPKRGWYIRIRTPSFPPTFFIPLVPVPNKSVYHTEGALSFKSRTNKPMVQTAASPSLSDLARASTSSVHSYPPTPPAGPSIVVRPPSPNTVKAELDKVSSSSSTSPSLNESRRKSRPPPPPSQITEFILTPHSFQPTPINESSSIFDKALSVIRNHRPSHSNSFTLSRIPVSSGGSGSDVLKPIPLLIFHDRTPVLTVRNLTGLLEIEQDDERMLGVDTVFWIAVGLTYLDFLEERESYLAALSD